MQLDEEGTFARVTRQRRELIEPNLAEHNGKLITYTGDGFLALFDSPVEAVRCAIVIQQSMVGRNASLPRDQWILYRIGIHLGDVVVGPSDVYGDGVNIAVRLEGIASPGDVFVSGGVYEQIKNKLVCAYQSLGDRQVKNITDPVSVYRVLPDPAALGQARRKRWPVALLAVLLAVNFAILGGLYFLLQQRQVANQAPTVAERTGPPAVTANTPPPSPCSGAGACGEAEGKLVGVCSGASAGRKAQRKHTIGARGVPDRGATDTGNGSGPGRRVLYGERRGPIRKANSPGHDQILRNRQIPHHSP